METIISRRGQTVIPAEIRKRHNIKDGDQLVWIDDGQSIRVIPIPADPIKALRGSGKGQNLTTILLDERRKDREPASPECVTAEEEGSTVLPENAGGGPAQPVPTRVRNGRRGGKHGSDRRVLRQGVRHCPRRR